VPYRSNPESISGLLFLFPPSAKMKIGLERYGRDFELMPGAGIISKVGLSLT